MRKQERVRGISKKFRILAVRVNKPFRMMRKQERGREINSANLHQYLLINHILQDWSQFEKKPIFQEM